jgi:hypothetical protein
MGLVGSPAVPPRVGAISTADRFDMHRVFGLLIFSSVALGVTLLIAGPDPLPAAGGASVLEGYGGWVAGLFMGLFVAWLVGLDWRNLPERIAAWVKRQRHRVGWMLLGGLCTGILVLL